MSESIPDAIPKPGRVPCSTLLLRDVIEPGFAKTTAHAIMRGVAADLVHLGLEENIISELQRMLYFHRMQVIVALMMDGVSVPVWILDDHVNSLSK